MKRTVLITLIAVLLASPIGLAGEEALGRGKVILSWDEFVKITGYDPSGKGTQTLTIPWSEVESLLGVKVDRVGKDTTVDLPWSEFKSLLEWSVKKQQPDAEPAAPAKYIFTRCKYSGTLNEDNAHFTLKANLDVLQKNKWTRIPLLPIEVAIKGAELPKGVYLRAADNRYELITKNEGAIEVSVDFTVAVTKSAGVARAAFPRIIPGSSVLDVTIESPKVDVTVARAQSRVLKPKDGKTHVVAVLPHGAAVSISWQRELPPVEKVPTKIYAETRTLVAVGEGVLLCQETVSFNILHSPIRELKLSVPKGISVLSVTGPHLKDWRIKNDELLAVLKAQTIGSTALRISYERLAKNGAEAPVLRALGVEREKGFIAAVALANVELTAGKVTGATPIDVRKLPGDIAAMTNQPILLAFRYLGDKFSIPLTIKKHGEVSVLVTIVDSAAYTAMQLNDGRRMTKVIYAVRNNRNQFLRMKMPEGAEIWSVAVGGSPASPAKDDQGNVLIPLIRSSRGASELTAFPVEIVYVNTPEATAPASGTLRVNLPTLDTPIMHVMVSYYLPVEGNYTASSGLFGTKSGFAGPLRIVDHFTTLMTSSGSRGLIERPANQAAKMQQVFDVQMANRAKAAGATPIRVRLPINGRLFQLEKILALPADKLYFKVTYSGWKVSE